jgi:predicted nucleic acid-binding protein
LILPDANIFLELLLDQKRAAECEELLDLVSKGQTEAVVTHFAVHTVEAVISDAKSLATFLGNLEHSAGLSIYDTNLSDEMAAALITRKIGLDFDDTLKYYVAKKLGVDALVSYDKHFDKVDMRRIEPRHLLHPSPTKTSQ